MYRTSSNENVGQPRLQNQSSYACLPTSNFSQNSMPGSLIPSTSFFNSSRSTCIDNSRKRPFDDIAHGNTPVQGNFKRQHIEGARQATPVGPQQAMNQGFINISINTLGRKIFSCYIGLCRFRSSTSELFEKHLCYTHAEQQNILRNFCELYETFDGEAPSFGDCIPFYGQQDNDPVIASRTSIHMSSPAENISSANSNVIPMYIKEEPEFHIVDEMYDPKKTICHDDDDIELDNSLDEKEQNDEMNVNTQIVLMESVKLLNKEITKMPAIKQAPQEPILLQESHEKTDKAETAQAKSIEEDLLVPFNLNSKPPKKSRQRAMSTFVDRDTISNKKRPSAHTTEDLKSHNDQLSETICLEFTNKKIKELKKNEGKDKYKNFKPNESIMDLFENTQEGSSRKSKKPRETQGDKLRKKFDGFNEMRNGSSRLRDSLRSRRSNEHMVDEPESSRSQKMIEAENSKKVVEDEDDSDDDLADLESLLEKINKITESDGKSKRSSSGNAQSSNENVATSKPNRADSGQNEHISRKNEACSKKNEVDSRKIETNSKQNQTASKSKLSIDHYFNKLENTTSNSTRKSQRKSPRTRSSAANFNEGIRSQIIQEKTPEKPKQKEKSSRESLNNKAQTTRDKTENSALKPIPTKLSNTSQNQSLETSSNSLNSSSTNLSKYTAAYTVDIEALMANAASSLEFINMKDLYPWISESITTTIFKTKSSVDILMTEFALFSTYKCMNELCYFFTTDFDEFKKHVKKHDSNNNCCCYCLKNFDKYAELCNHLDVVHRFDRFQCNKCMYRSCQKGYVDIHQKHHHEDIDSCEVFKSPVQKLMKSDRSKCIPALQKNREKFVMPYRCKTPKCREIFYSKENFRKHLEAESNRENYQEFVTLIYQQLCAIDHSKTAASTAEGIHQCLHCQYGTDDGDIMQHMALNHPHNFAYICKRAKPQKLIELNILSARETIENSTTIEYIGTTTTEAKSFGGDLDRLISTNLEKKKDGTKSLVVSEVVTIED